jgi:hypothetical protein
MLFLSIRQLIIMNSFFELASSLIMFSHLEVVISQIDSIMTIAKIYALLITAISL